MKRVLFLHIGLTLLVNVGAQNLDSLKYKEYIDSLKHREYLKYEKTIHNKSRLLSEDKWTNQYIWDFKQDMYKPTPGSYLIKAKNLFIGGLLLNTASVAIVVFNSQNSDAIYGIAGMVGLIGIGLEIGGVVQIGKAGLSLNQNGIGVKVNF
jgi:hypothetical protein